MKRSKVKVEETVEGFAYDLHLVRASVLSYGRNRSAAIRVALPKMAIKAQASMRETLKVNRIAALHSYIAE